MRILIVEDELEISRLIKANLTRAGYVVDCVRTIALADEAMALNNYSLVLLDRRLPDGDGIKLLERIKIFFPELPTIILTALDSIPNRIQGLDSGAIDYIVKPCDADELLARIRAALRRPTSGLPPIIVCHDLAYSPVTQEVTVRNETIVLKRRELAVLGALMRRLGRVVLRETLIQEVYSFDEEVNSNTLDAHVSRLRARLVECDCGATIHAIRGIGYILDRK